MGYLDDNGLLYLWGKIKSIIPTKTSTLTNDSGFITADDIPEGAAASNTTPKAPGTAAVGTETAFARGDHVHPSDSTKVDKVSGKGLSTNDLTNALKSNYDAAYTHSQAAHAPAGAQVNVLESVKVNGTALAITSKAVDVPVPTKVSELTNDEGYLTDDNVMNYVDYASATVFGKVKIGTNIDVSSGVASVKDGTTSAKGVVQLSSATNSSSTALAATASAVKAAYDLAAGKQSPQTTIAGYGITNAYTKNEVDTLVNNRLVSAVKYKGTKENYSDLPTTGNSTGDMWNITNADASKGIKAGDNVVFSGTGWDVQSGNVDLSGCVQSSDTITNSEIDAIVAS